MFMPQQNYQQANVIPVEEQPKERLRLKMTNEEKYEHFLVIL